MFNSKCLFHPKKCFNNENDEHFNVFVNQCNAISALPLEDIEKGLNRRDFKELSLKIHQNF